jgi:hypothetical protein
MIEEIRYLDTCEITSFFVHAKKEELNRTSSVSSICNIDHLKIAANFCQVKVSERQFSYIVHMCQYMRAWRRVGLPCNSDHYYIICHRYVSWIRPVAMNARCRHASGEKVRMASLLQGSGLVRTV